MVFLRNVIKGLQRERVMCDDLHAGGSVAFIECLQPFWKTDGSRWCSHYNRGYGNHLFLFYHDLREKTDDLVGFLCESFDSLSIQFERRFSRGNLLSRCLRLLAGGNGHLAECLILTNEFLRKIGFKLKSPSDLSKHLEFIQAHFAIGRCDVNHRLEDCETTCVGDLFRNLPESLDCDVRIPPQGRDSSI